MSIGYKKLLELVDEEVDLMKDLSAKNKVVLAQLCKKLYEMETSASYLSSQKLIDDMAGEISNAADKLKDNG